MKRISNLFKNSRFMRYLVIGGGVYLLEIGIILLAQESGANGTVAVAIAFWSGLLVSFVLQKIVTFGDTRTHHKVILKQVAAVTALVLWNFAFTMLLTKLLADTLSPAVARTLALVITTLWNFQLYRISIFRGSENPIY